ncbi:MAG: aminomethyl-transferring glycine dehydrogenase subunit GcvPB [Bacteroidales bacterium]|nr:aminomethyl-transferring glycine dehydrogenase subunit GcvPB [Bacteroidales bacterium]MBD5206165.1 aminomethyl-transferring glycine dehydrogenase subunit GcvPB [Bacteroidales bacterium]MBD5223531.1 aminomethyl-transferring glycine dehydrogenase subunit GcvPB [Bacteroidales bacterium]MBD5302505.1 aminomethyl-transferring glycine dehydrogenase subunit GcvPB [Bacteroides sp.]
MKKYDKLIFELSRPGRKGYQLPADKFDTDGFTDIPSNLLREKAPELPEVSELDVVRHYTNLSNKNFGVDTGFYPLGSCTMKYNPKINEEIASMPEFAGLHPLQDASSAQGALELYYNLQQALASLSGLAEFTLNPYAGAHGELTGLMVMRQYHNSRGDHKRTKVIVPDTAHGTNPASAMVAGLEVVEVKSKPNGSIDVEDLKPLLDDTVAGIMMTNPNTVGMFETDILEIADLVHKAGGLLYYDGANLNPLLGKVRPGDMGFDIMHINLHKTFSTPHGGGGPGSGPVGVAAHLVNLLPNPRVRKAEDGSFFVDTDKESLGSVSTFFGNFGVMMKAYAYILSLGRDNIKNVGPMATLNANYIKESLKDVYKLPIEGVCKHEFVFDGLADKSTGVTTLNVAKRLLDFGFHAPTIYFPLLFHESMMIEPTETESLETLDEFIEVMRRVAQEAKENPELVKSAPVTTEISHPDETGAAKNPILSYKALKDSQK